VAQFIKGGDKGAGDLSQEEVRMVNRKQAGFHATIGLVCLIMVFSGCAGGQATQQLVVTEYLLKEAGFQAYRSNMETPKTQALLDAIPKGVMTTFKGDGRVYHAYPDERSNTIYVGDQAAYEKYVSLARGKQVCERVDAASSSGFWSCFDELQQKGVIPPGR
jgi:hypothetical protein